jgi:hypothetical protein
MDADNDGRADALPGCPVSCGQCRWRDQVKDLVVVGQGPGAGCGARRGYLRPGHGTEGGWFQFVAAAGASYRISTALVDLPDSVLTLYEIDRSTTVATNDDAGPGELGSEIIWTAPAAGGGVMWVKVAAVRTTQSGIYQLTVRAAGGRSGEPSVSHSKSALQIYGGVASQREAGCRLTLARFGPGRSARPPRSRPAGTASSRARPSPVMKFSPQ